MISYNLISCNLLPIPLVLYTLEGALAIRCHCSMGFHWQPRCLFMSSSSDEHGGCSDSSLAQTPLPLARGSQVSGSPTCLNAVGLLSSYPFPAHQQCMAFFLLVLPFCWPQGKWHFTGLYFAFSLFWGWPSFSMFTGYSCFPSSNCLFLYFAQFPLLSFEIDL